MSSTVKQTDNIYSVLLPKEAISLDAVAFDSFVHTYGVRFIHAIALPCPIGLDDPTDIRRTHDDHVGCSNGHIYTMVGRVTCLFSSNTTAIKHLDSGLVDGSSVAVTFSRFYDDDPKRRVLVRPFDRFLLEEDNITSVATNQMKRRQDGRADRPSYPALAVHILIDSDGNGYLQGTDFVLDRGDISWLPGKGPTAGKTYSIHYEYKPFFYCDRLIHEIRVIPTKDFVNTHQIRNERLSFGAILNREYIRRTNRPDLLSPDIGGRQQQVPDLDLPATPGVDPQFG
jgi:hypothetical protein